MDETGVKTDEHKTDKAIEAAEASAAPEATETDTPDGADTPEDTYAAKDDDTTDGTDESGTPAGPSGVGQGAGAVVSAGLGIVSLTGSWVGTVASARASLIGQLETSSSSTNVGMMIQKGYGNAWHATAMWGGVFALIALVVGVIVLARPAFGAPGLPQTPWIKSVSWAGVALGVIGLILSVLKYTDILLGLPAAG